MHKVLLLIIAIRPSNESSSIPSKSCLVADKTKLVNNKKKRNAATSAEFDSQELQKHWKVVLGQPPIPSQSGQIGTAEKQSEVANPETEDTPGEVESGEVCERKSRSNFQDWLEYQKRKWRFQKEQREYRRREEALGHEERAGGGGSECLSASASASACGESSGANRCSPLNVNLTNYLNRVQRSVLDSHWHIIQVRGKGIPSAPFLSSSSLPLPVPLSIPFPPLLRFLFASGPTGPTFMP